MKLLEFPSVRRCVVSQTLVNRNHRRENSKAGRRGESRGAGVLCRESCVVFSRRRGEA